VTEPERAALMRVRGDPHLAVEQHRIACSAQHGLGVAHQPIVSRQVIGSPMDDDLPAAVDSDPVRRIGQILAHHPPIDTALRRGP
jgi:hypothetical protein